MKIGPGPILGDDMRTAEVRLPDIRIKVTKNLYTIYISDLAKIKTMTELFAQTNRTFDLKLPY